MTLRAKRFYEESKDADGEHILRIWSRGFSNDMDLLSGCYAWKEIRRWR